MEVNIRTIQLTREQFLAVYHAADLLTDLVKEEQHKKIPGGGGQDIVDLTYNLWRLYDACGGAERRLETKL